MAIEGVAKLRLGGFKHRDIVDDPAGVDGDGDVSAGDIAFLLLLF